MCKCIYYVFMFQLLKKLIFTTTVKSNEYLDINLNEFWLLVALLHPRV